MCRWPFYALKGNKHEWYKEVSQPYLKPQLEEPDGLTHVDFLLRYLPKSFSSDEVIRKGTEDEWADKGQCWPKVRLCYAKEKWLSVLWELLRSWKGEKVHQNFSAGWKSQAEVRHLISQIQLFVREETAQMSC